ncbi:UTRA domain-containing protein [Kribbella italica]|uniref:GntR family transcriptional regulator n=1 Tax=Kribbella italica TaxID=1540520 RepID=A0A7W9JEQ8_9ACTN|nr:GntR family transcriptional regulator [Kribbella italica]
MTTRSIPRHEAVERHLRSRIASSKPGDALESDSELTALFNVSRMTVRQAAQRLADQGLIYRVPGVGTFVAEPRVHRDIGRLRSFTEEMARRGAVAGSKVLVAALRAGTADEVAALQLAPGSKVTHVRRLRLADSRPVAIENVVLPMSCSAVLEGDLEHGSLHDALRALGEIPTSASGTLVAVNAGVEDEELLAVEPRTALLVEERLILDQSGRPLEKTQTRYAGDEFVFDVSLTR